MEALHNNSQMMTASQIGHPSMIKIGCWAALGALLAGCVRLDSHGFSDSALVADIRSGSPIGMDKYTPFAWDHLYIYEPRNSRETIKEETGTSVPYPHLDGGGYCLLVFTQEGRITAAFEEPRAVVDFMNLYQKGGYTRVAARFKGAIGPDGSVVLQKIAPGA
jgi:hypothetical protein